jgi:hypothetical protein
MRPIFSNEANTMIDGDFGSMPWDVENARPLDYQCEAGRLYQQALTDNDMTEPDPYKPPSQPINPALDSKPAKTTAQILGVT